MGKSNYKQSRSSLAEGWPYFNFGIPLNDLSPLAERAVKRLRGLKGKDGPNARLREVAILQLLVEKHPQIYERLKREAESEPVAA